MFRERYRDIAAATVNPKTGGRTIHYGKALGLRRALLEETFFDLVKLHYIQEYFKTKPEESSAEGMNEFIKNSFVKTKETPVVEYRDTEQHRFFIIQGYGEFYMLGFRYKDGALRYDGMYKAIVFDKIWNDINLAMEFVKQHAGAIFKYPERAKLFRKYLMEDANDYPNSDELKREIKEIFLPFAAAELTEQVEQDLQEAVEQMQGRAEATRALEAFTSERLSDSLSRIVPYEEPRQTMLQPFSEQYGLKLWTTLYEKHPLPKKVAERIKMFLMNNFWSIFVLLVPYEISSSRRLEEEITADNRSAIAFKEVMSGFLDSLKQSLFVAKGGYGQAAYMVSKENLAWLYADELALKEVYIKYSADHPEIMSLFKKLYRWTKDVDEQIELEQIAQARRDQALKQYLRSYEEELEQEDLPPKRMLKKVLLPEDKEAIETFRIEGYTWNQLKTAM